MVSSGISVLTTAALTVEVKDGVIRSQVIVWTVVTVVTKETLVMKVS